MSRWFVACLWVSLASCYATPRKISNAATEGRTSEDRIGIDDVFDVRVYGEPDLTGSYRVANEGTIDFPLAGRVVVAGLRTGDIQGLLVTKLGNRVLRNPQITVTVKE